MIRSILLGALLMLAAGCWNGGNSNIRLGDVSLGQQFIDLQRALDAGALTQSEYDQTKARLLELTTLCEGTEEGTEEHALEDSEQGSDA